MYQCISVLVYQCTSVRQGCILSPLLFNLFLNELPLSINDRKTDPIILPNGDKLNTLFYADDLVFISRSKIGLLIV